jgi:hypothetical protein
MLQREEIARNARNVGVRACCAGRRSSLRSLRMRTPKPMRDGSLPVVCDLALAVAIDASSTSQKAPESARQHEHEKSVSIRYAQAICTIMRSAGRSGSHAIDLEVLTEGRPVWKPVCHAAHESQQRTSVANDTAHTNK